MASSARPDGRRANKGKENKLVAQETLKFPPRQQTTATRFITQVQADAAADERTRASCCKAGRVKAVKDGRTDPEHQVGVLREGRRADGRC